MGDHYDKEGDAISLEKNLPQSGSGKWYPARVTWIFIAFKARAHISCELSQIDWRKTLREGITSTTRAFPQSSNNIMFEGIMQPIKIVLPEVKKLNVVTTSKS
jgi:hypothetical protein